MRLGAARNRSLSGQHLTRSTRHPNHRRVLRPVNHKRPRGETSPGESGVPWTDDRLPADPHVHEDSLGGSSCFGVSGGEGGAFRSRKRAVTGWLCRSFTVLKMVDRAPTPPVACAASDGVMLPRPTLHYRLRAWRAFERALDPLGPLRRPCFPVTLLQVAR